MNWMTIWLRITIKSVLTAITLKILNWWFQEKQWHCWKVRWILPYYVSDKLFIVLKNLFITWCLCFPVHRWKTIAIRLCATVSKQTAKTRSPWCCKEKQKVWIISWFSWSGFCSQFNENSNNNQDPHRQIENDKIPEAEYPNENDSEDTETNKTSAISNFTPEILPDDEIA